MRLERSISLDAPQADVWALVDDVEALGACIPGLESLEAEDERHFGSVVRMRLGPVGVRFALRTAIEEIEPPSRLVMTTEGVDRAIAGRVRQRQVFELTPEGERTRVRITSEVTISGRLASFGQRVIAAKADELLDEVVVNVTKLLAERRDSGPLPRP